jgi:succinate dehydrogenase / fumarate reductase iron-sulfur subunit
MVMADSPDSDRTRVGEGRLPVSEFAAEVQGGLSPFGEDVQFPLPPEEIHYRHPGPEDRPHLAGDTVQE